VATSILKKENLTGTFPKNTGRDHFGVLHYESVFEERESKRYISEEDR